MNTEQYNKFGHQILDSCFQVHKELGPGLLESVYHYALLKELEIRDIAVKSKVLVVLGAKDVTISRFFMNIKDVETVKYSDLNAFLVLKKSLILIDSNVFDKTEKKEPKKVK